MRSRRYVILSCATSADGYLDDASPRRLILSGPADLDRVDDVRAGCDAILVGAGTVRADDPRLLIRDPRRRARRAARGRPHPPGSPSPPPATWTPGPLLGPGAERLVDCATPALAPARARLGDRAVLIDAGHPLSLEGLLSDLTERNVVRLLVEGGSRVLAEFLAATWPMNSSWPPRRSSWPTPPPPPRYPPPRCPPPRCPRLDAPASMPPASMPPASKSPRTPVVPAVP